MWAIPQDIWPEFLQKVHGPRTNKQNWEETSRLRVKTGIDSEQPNTMNGTCLDFEYAQTKF